MFKEHQSILRHSIWTIVALVLGSQRASTARVAKALGIAKPEAGGERQNDESGTAYEVRHTPLPHTAFAIRVATPEEVLERTGYLAGGVPPFGYSATFLIDPTVMEKEIVYAEGGTPNAIIRTSTKDIQRINKGAIARARK